MTDPFEELVHQLGAALGLSLHVDHNRACTLKIHHQLSIQIQLDAAQEKVLIASFIAELPPGRFRENVLCEALKTNDLPDPRTAILSYVASGNRLAMHQSYPLVKMDGAQLAMLTASFIDYAELWREAIEKGQTSPAPIANTVKSINPFGLR